MFKVKGARGSAVVEVAVVGHEKVWVPAGVFDALTLVATGTIRGVSGINSQIAGETKTTYWYAPAARAIVKSVSHNLTSGYPPSSWSDSSCAPDARATQQEEPMNR